MTPNEPATDKQVRYLRHLSLKGRESGNSAPRINYATLTKREACALIQSYVERDKSKVRKSDGKPLITYLGEGKIQRYFDMTVDDGGESYAESIGVPWIGAEEFESMLPPCWVACHSEIPF